MGSITEPFVIGIIGMGDMGRMYALKLSAAGWSVHVCDKRDNYEDLKNSLLGHSNIEVLPDGHFVSSSSDYILYSVEAGSIEKVVGEYGSSTKNGAIVGGQTSCKAPEILAFERHLPKSTDIISVHSLHGPQTDPEGQPLAIVPHRASSLNTRKVENIFSCLQSNTVILSATDHDHITSNTQALISTILLSIGTAYQLQNTLIRSPWDSYLKNPTENSAFSLVPRIYAQKWHIYAGLSLLNPFVAEKTNQYAKSTKELNTLIRNGELKILCARLRYASSTIFPVNTKVTGASCAISNKLSKLQSTIYLALFATIDTWAALDICPAQHLPCSTPQYRLWLSLVENICFQPRFLEDVLERICVEGRGSQELAEAAACWAKVVEDGDFMAYQRFFEKTGCWLDNLSSGMDGKTDD